MMQETRQQILEILRDTGQSTVDDIVQELRKRRGDAITAVTVRHHLKLLQDQHLIQTPQLRHRNTPGRPQHIYELTEQADEHFPNNYQRLATTLLNQLEAHLPPEGVNVIMEGVADSMAAEAQITDAPLPKRLDFAVQYLNEHGYHATWEQCDEGYVLHTHNCPYHHLAQKTDALCGMDMRLVSSLLGVVPRLMSRISDGGSNCAYLIPIKAEQTAK